MTTHVLLTGAGGFVGSHVLGALLDDEANDYHVTCLDSFRHNGATDKIAAVAADRRDRITVVTHDLRAPVSYTMLDQLHQCEYVINPASLCQVDQSIVQPVEFIKNNVDTMLTVMDLARNLGVRGVVHVSTDEVYGPHTPFNHWEHRPSSPYAASKAAQEDICHAFARTYDIPTKMITSANMFGERQSHLAYIPRVIRAALRDEVIEVHTQDGVPGRRQYTYVRNVAHHIVELLRTEFRMGAPTKIHLTGQLELDNLTVMSWVSELVGSQPRHQLVDVTVTRPGYDQSYARLTPDSAWQPKISFEDGLKLTVAWARDNLTWL